MDAKAFAAMLSEEYDGILSNSSSKLKSELKRLGFLVDRKVDEGEYVGYRHWLERGWHPSLDYYLWSKCFGFVDAMDPTGEKRQKTIRSYMEYESPPQRLKAKGPTLNLPPPESVPSRFTIGELLMNRRSVRIYARSPATTSLLSSVLWEGLREVIVNRTRKFRNELDYLRSYGVAIDYYVIVYPTEGQSPGVYQYDPPDHSMTLIRSGNMRNKMVRLLFGSVGPRSACWTILFVADFAQYQWRYRHERALRNLYLEVGRIAQKLTVRAMTFGLGSFVTPALNDRETGELLRTNRDRQAPLYAVTMGWDNRLIYSRT